MLRQLIENHLIEQLSAPAIDHFSGGFDEIRKADTRPANRRLAYGLAWAAHGECERLPLFRSEAAWKAVVDFFDRICDLQKKDGSWDWYVPNQAKMFAHVYPFAMVSLLRTRIDFSKHFDPPLKHRMDAMFHRAIEPHLRTANQFLETGKRNVGLNILASLMSALYVGGNLLKEKAWCDLASQTMHAILAKQDPAGFWPDDGTHQGPATLYNTVTVTHVAEYALASRDPTAIDSLIRSAEFHRAFVYPDGSLVETIDERNRYHHGTIPALLTAYAVFSKSRPIAAEYASMLGDKGVAGLSPQAMDLYGTLPDSLWVDAWRHTPDDVKLTRKPASFQHYVPSIPALVQREKPWQICLSACLRSGPARRYHYDLQNHLSIWHDRLGLIVGGGNSLHDPYFSTFRFREQYLASRAAIEEGASPAARFSYGAIDASLRVNVMDENRVEILAESKGIVPDDSLFVLHLPQQPGGAFVFNGEPRTLSREAIHLEALAPITIGNVKLSCDRSLHLNWPCLPIDIYDPPKRDEPHAVFHVAANLKAGPVRILLEIVQ